MHRRQRQASCPTHPPAFIPCPLPLRAVFAHHWPVFGSSSGPGPGAARNLRFTPDPVRDAGSQTRRAAALEAVAGWGWGPVLRSPAGDSDAALCGLFCAAALCRSVWPPAVIPEGSRGHSLLSFSQGRGAGGAPPPHPCVQLLLSSGLCIRLSPYTLGPSALQLCGRLWCRRSGAAACGALAEDVSKTLLSTLPGPGGRPAHLPGTGWWWSQTLSSCPDACPQGTSRVRAWAAEAAGAPQALCPSVCVPPMRRPCQAVTLPPGLRRQVVAAGTACRVISRCDDCPVWCAV